MEGTIMTKNQMILSAVIVSAFALAAYVTREGSLGVLIERFPDVDPKIVKKVHKEMIREALRGKYANSVLSDEDYDLIFMSKVHATALTS